MRYNVEAVTAVAVKTTQTRTGVVPRSFTTALHPFVPAADAVHTPPSLREHVHEDTVEPAVATWTVADPVPLAFAIQADPDMVVVDVSPVTA
jgi:hypothetical protein